MSKTYKVEMTYFAGKREGQIITWFNVKDEDVLEIMDDLTREQISNAEIMIIIGDEKVHYEDFLYHYYILQSTKRQA